MRNGKVRLKIEHGIPIPARGANQYGPWAEALRAMDPGDSFLVDTDKVRASVLRYSKKHAIKVVSAKISGIGYRIWKIQNNETKARPNQGAA